MDEVTVVVKKSHKKLFTAIITVSVIIIVLLAAAGIILYKATKPLNEGRFNAEATFSMKEGFMKAMLIGGTTKFTSEDFNSMLAYSAEKKREKAVKQGKSDKVTLTEFEFNAQGSSKLYVRAFKGPFTFDIVADVDIRLDKEQELVVFEILDAKLGDFPIKPETVIENYRKSLAEEGEDNEFIKLTDTAITFPSSYSYNLFANKLNFAFQELRVEDGAITVEAESPFGDWGEFVYSLLFGDEGKEQQ